MVAATHQVLARWEQVRVVAVREIKVCPVITAAMALWGAFKLIGHKV
jgi:hypothetical protein